VQVTDLNNTDTVPVVWEPAENLTLDATAERVNATGANPVDSPGFVNTYGVDTGGTTENGNYVLSEVPTDFQSGVGYVAIATKAGFSADYADVNITEDGQLEFTEQQGSNDFYLEPVPVQPDTVNITQVGTHPPLSETGGAPDTSQITEFSDQSDPTYQRVSRERR